MPRNISVLVWSNASGWRWMLAMVCPIRYPMPAPGPITAVPAATPIPTYLSPSVLPCSSANASMFPAPLYSLSVRSLVILAEHRQFDVNLREYSEYVSLKDRDEDLEGEEDYRRWHGDHRHERAEVQDEAEEDEDDQVPRQDVGVESQSESERLGELLESLDEPHERDHDRLERQSGGHEALWIPYGTVSPEALVLGEDEGEGCQRQRERDVARHGVA